MSEPTYRIEIEHDAGTATRYVYNWYVHRLSNDSLPASGYAVSREDAREQAIDAIKRLRAEQAPETLYVSEDGEIVPAPEPQSLRA